MKKALIVYYSFTGQAKRLVEHVTQDLAAAGFAVTQGRVDFADPSVRLERPLKLAHIKQWTQAAESGQCSPVLLDPPEALQGRYDLVCIFSNTWQHHPAVPIRSLLASPDLQSVLNGTPFGIYVVCRRSWQKNMDVVRQQAQGAGGRFLGGEHFAHGGGNAASLVRTISYLISTGGVVARLLGIRLPLPEYGLPNAVLERSGQFTRGLLAKLQSDPAVHETPEPRRPIDDATLIEHR